MVALVGFSGEANVILGEVGLLVYMEGMNLNTTFLINNAYLTYNVFLERPWIHELREIL